MTNNPAKIQKRITKKKGSINSLHENSRDSKRLRRACARAEKLEKLSASRAKAREPFLHRIGYFQSAAREAEGRISNETCQGLIESYIGRFKTEVSSIAAQRKPGRAASSWEDALRHRITIEEHEYNSGYWLPDMENPENLDLLLGWDQDWTSLGVLKFIRLSRQGIKKDSSFPPKGLS